MEAVVLLRGHPPDYGLDRASRQLRGLTPQGSRLLGFNRTNFCEACIAFVVPIVAASYDTSLLKQHNCDPIQ